LTHGVAWVLLLTQALETGIQSLFHVMPAFFGPAHECGAINRHYDWFRAFAGFGV